jgi:hypothetical protein
MKVKITLGRGLKWSNARNNGNLKIKKGNMTIGNLMFKIRMLLGSIDQSEALFLFIDNITLVCNSDLLLHVHNRHAINGILHMTIMKETIFG